MWNDLHKGILQEFSDTRMWETGKTEEAGRWQMYQVLLERQRVNSQVTYEKARLAPGYLSHHAARMAARRAAMTPAEKEAAKVKSRARDNARHRAKRAACVS